MLNVYIKNVIYIIHITFINNGVLFIGGYDMDECNRAKEINTKRKSIGTITKKVLVTGTAIFAGILFDEYIKSKFKPKIVSKNTENLNDLSNNKKKAFELDDINKYSENKANGFSTFTDKESKSYSNRSESYVNGSGIYAREMADELGLKCKTTDGPNVVLVNKVLKKIKVKPTGCKNKDQITCNNGGHGYHPFKTNLYSRQDKSKVKEYLEQNSKVIDNVRGLYECVETPFRKK